MFRSKLFLAAALTLSVSAMSTSAAAQEPYNQLTYFTFSAPFELPGGKTLPAGKYVFKIIDSPSNRHTVRIFSEDQTTLHGTVMAIPAERMEPSDEPEIRFMETPANMPPAVRTWWYPGRRIGHEFIYPKDHARRLAAHQREGVLTTAGDSTDMQSGELARIDASGEETAWTTETATADATATTPAAQTPAVTTAETTTTTSTTTPAVTMAPETTSATAETTAQPMPEPAAGISATEESSRTAVRERTELPRTASPLPLFALIGLGSLAAAGVLRLRRK